MLKQVIIGGPQNRREVSVFISWIQRTTSSTTSTSCITRRTIATTTNSTIPPIIRTRRIRSCTSCRSSYTRCLPTTANATTSTIIRGTSTNTSNSTSASTSNKTTSEKAIPATSTNYTKAYADLAKWRLSALVVSTTAVGYVAAGLAGSATTTTVATAAVLASSHSSSMAVLASCCVGTALCSSSAAALNHIFEQSRDGKMKRTQQRPLVTGALAPVQAYRAAALWGLTGTSLLYYGTDPTTALLGLSNIALYAGLYTYLKPRSIYNTWVGALVGAIPPVMGWSAATAGSLLDPHALVLGYTLYLWQMPHFFALSYMHRVDYQRGGFQMLGVLDGPRTGQTILRYACYLTAVPFLTTATGMTSSMFALEGILLNGYALKVAHQFHRQRTNAHARQIFITSLWYLPCWLMLYLLHLNHHQTNTEESEKNALVRFIWNRLEEIRQHGRNYCLHETHKNEESDKSCPAVLLKKKATLIETSSATSTATACSSQEAGTTE